jgi:hypothetical protein
MARLRRWQVELQKIPPDDRSRDIFDYPIFRFNAGGKRKHISGRVRSLLNARQLPRWDYFFRPNFYLLRAVDEAIYNDLQKELVLATNKRKALDELPNILTTLETANNRRTTSIALMLLFGSIAIAAYFFLNTFWLIGVVVFAVIGSAAVWSTYAGGDIKNLEDAKQRMSIEAGESLDSNLDIRSRHLAIEERIVAIEAQLEAIIRFHRDIFANKPSLTLSENDMDAFLKDAVKHLVEREQRRLNYYDDERSLIFEPIIRWALETDRKHVLDALKPAVYSVARRGIHYARYNIQVIFVHRGQLTLYQGFYDLIQGEFMGEARSHVVLANLFSVRDETSVDFDFRRRLQDAISLSSSDGPSEDSEESEEDVHLEASDDDNQEDDADNVSLVQTTIVRLIGGGEPIELRFVVSGHREGLIAQLQLKRKMEEEAIANLEAESSQAGDDTIINNELKAHEERLRRIREAEAREQRSITTYDVENVVNQILEHTRQATGRQTT